MTSNKMAILGILAASIVAFSAPSGAQEAKKSKVEDFTCKDVMREHGDARDIAISFLHGFLLGKSGNSEFDLEKLMDQTDEFIDSCLDNPGEKAVDIMQKVRG